MTKPPPQEGDVTPAPSLPPPDPTGARHKWARVADRIRSITPRGLTRFTLVAGALYVIGWLIVRSWSVLMPFQIGIVLAYLLLPLVNRLNRYLPRWAAILVVFSIGGLALALVIGLVVPPLTDQVRSLIASIPDNAQFQVWIGQVRDFYATLPPQTQEFLIGALKQADATIRSNVTTYLQGLLSFLITSLMSIVNTFSFILGFLVIPVWLFFVMNDYDKGVHAFNALLPAWMRADFWAVPRIVDRVLSKYIRGQLFLGLVVGVAVYAGLWLIELIGLGPFPYKLLLALIAAVTELIPYVGPILGAVPGVIIGFTQSWQLGVAALVLYIVVQQIENNFLVPKVTGEAVDIHAAILTVVLLALSQFGLVWVILAAPLAAILRDLYVYVYGRFQEPPHPAGVLPGELSPKSVVVLPLEETANAAPASPPPPKQRAQ